MRNLFVNFFLIVLLSSSCNYVNRGLEKKNLQNKRENKVDSKVELKLPVADIPILSTLFFWGLSLAIHYNFGIKK